MKMLCFMLMFVLISPDNGQVTTTGSIPDCNVTPVIKSNYVQVYCDDNGNSLSTEFVKNGRTQCHLSREHNSCGACKCNFFNQRSVMIKVNGKPKRGEEYGCQMILRETFDIWKMYCYVIYDNGGFTQLQREVYNRTNNGFEDEESFPSKDQDNKQSQKDIVIAVVLSISGIVAVTSVFIFFCALKLRREHYREYTAAPSSSTA